MPKTRPAGRARRPEMVWMRSFSRWGRRWAATLMSAATAGVFVVFPTIDDHAVAVCVSGECADQGLSCCHLRQTVPGQGNRIYNWSTRSHGSTKELWTHRMALTETNPNKSHNSHVKTVKLLMGHSQSN